MPGTLNVMFALWDGLLFGGAETATIALASELRAHDIEPTIVFVGSAGVYAPILARLDLPHDSLGLDRGSKVLLHPRAFARTAASCGRDAAVLPSAGFMARALRLGGFDSPVVAVEHGGLLQFPTRSAKGKIRDIVDRRLGIGCVDAQVAVSEFLLRSLMRVPHAERVVMIHNGVDVDAYRRPEYLQQSSGRDRGEAVRIGMAGKLMPGKGFEDVLSALGSITTDKPWSLSIAGEGERESALRTQADRLNIGDRVDFKGWIDDMPAFWNACDLAVAASNGCVESFGMTVVEAFACGVPVLVSRSGGLTEVLGSTGAGASFDPGDIDTLADLICRFVDDDSARQAASKAAWERADEFSIQRTAGQFRDLLDKTIEGLERERA